MKRIITTDDAPKAIGPYSQAVESGNMLFISGQVPIHPATGKLVEGGIAEQTAQVLDNVGAILKAAGYAYTDVVKSTCFLTDMKHFAEMNAVYARYYPSEAPARAAFAVKDLPAGALVEIETVAAR
ncbi:MAG: RidA family protein [Bacteroidales bacterium]|jgi:2-iminobutanoate/2-iminopropanoate deaminase|nr:RidA family protein [Bacteroidales bacterium]